LATVDIVILGVVLLSAVIGLVRGLLREVLSLASWLAAFILALHFAPLLSGSLEEQLADDAVRLVVSFVAIFLTTLLVGAVAQWLVGTLIRSTGLTGTDRFLGFLFGSTRGALLCIVAVMALRQFVEAGQWWQSSVLVPELLAFEHEVLKLMGLAREWAIDLGQRE
jgi:membrane protein required for colicin V production